MHCWLCALSTADCYNTVDGIVHFKPDSLTMGVSYQQVATAILTAQWDYVGMCEYENEYMLRLHSNELTLTRVSLCECRWNVCIQV